MATGCRLPEPKTGGTVDDLRPFLNVDTDEDWVLCLAWLTAALRPTGPYPLIVVSGEQGSAKSTFCRILGSLIDPRVAPLRPQPRDERDLMIAASNSWILAFDNLSRISQSMSDAFCRLATGGGFSTRELYTNDGEELFDVTRPVLANGISDLASRSDLLDRAICLTLPPILPNRRQTEAKLWATLEDVRPRILGALLDAVSTALDRLAGVNLEHPPRMADFATWAVAAEPGFGVKPGAFIEAYAGKRAVSDGGGG